MARMIGTAQNDDFFASPAGSTIEALGGRDLIYGNVGDDLLYGGAGDDVLVDNRGGADRFYGGSGNDLLEISRYFTMRGGPLLLDGGGGDDVIRVYNSIGVQPLYTDVRVIGGSGNDQIYASGIAGVIEGGSGDDFISSQYSAATIDAGTGNDFVSFYGQEGHDGSILAGTGNDTIQATVQSADLSISGGDGNDVVTLSIQGGSHQGRVDLGAGNDRVTAYALTPDAFISVLGGAGNDIMIASGFTVEARGGSGSDHIQVEATSAIIDAGSGLDTVMIRSGGDYLVVLGDGPDRLEIDALFTHSEDTFDYVTVTDFRTGASGDVLDLSGALALAGWTAEQGDPFAAGYARLRPFPADDTSTFFSTFIDLSLGDGHWFTTALLLGVPATSLNGYNLDGIGG